MIKFRGIPLEDTNDIDGVKFDGTFVYGNYVKYGEGALIVGDALQADEDGCWPSWWVPVDPDTVEQFTGLKDVNGRDIYIGDIVNVWSNMSELTMEPTVNEIVSEDLFGTPGMFLKPLREHFIEPCLHDYWSNQFEVIGNVHTNHELLEEDK
ncbi:YopX family protein [Lactiplantibacillus plantarum]|uniref:YopX family protein n=1 Tax=Lactiplantibacillus plantarum TaxID=1590 RepID=UPI0021C7958B|nr:YopX family protein [Lactiplantibacillus plantarum]